MKRFFLLMAVNILVVATISLILNIFGIGQYMTSAGLQYGPLLAFCMVWGLVGSLISLLLSKKLAKWTMGVQIITSMGPHQKIVDSVHRLARRAGLTEMPEVGIYQDATLNAFATGPSRNNSLVAVSTGLMASMNQEEIDGVLAHEVAHIANGDMVTMALVQGVVNAFVMFFSRVVAYFITQSMKNNDDKESRPNPFVQMMLVFVLDIVFGLLAAPLVAWFSRYREFRADKGSADLGGKENMIKALQSLKRAYPQLSESKSENNSFQSMQISSKDKFMRIFSSHPSLDERINALINEKNVNLF